MHTSWVGGGGGHPDIISQASTYLRQFFLGPVPPPLVHPVQCPGSWPCSAAPSFALPVSVSPVSEPPVWLPSSACCAVSSAHWVTNFLQHKVIMLKSKGHSDLMCTGAMGQKVMQPDSVCMYYIKHGYSNSVLRCTHPGQLAWRPRFQPLDCRVTQYKSAIES